MAGCCRPRSRHCARRATRRPRNSLYRFASAGTAGALRADVRTLARSLPRGAIVATQSYLAVRQQEDTGIAPIVPFVVAFGIIGLVLSVLIVVNVVSGAVVAGFRRIGVLKSIGFTPAQVVATYASQVAVPALVGCLAGVVLGNVLAVPMLGQTASVYQVGALAVPPWVDVAVPVAMCCLAGLAAIVLRLSGRGGSARSRRSRPGGLRCRAAGMPRTGCWPGCGCRGR